jgi:carbonic anhydrase
MLRITCAFSLILAVQGGLYATDGTSDRYWGYAPTQAGLDANTCGMVANASCGPLNWAEVDVGNSSCGALYQSPIRVNTSTATYFDAHVAFKLSSDPTCTNGGMYNVDPHGVSVNINTTCQSKFQATWDIINRTNFYNLKSYSFHTPAEHMMDGQFFDMEAHLVHVNNVTGDLLVLAVFMNSDPSLKAKCIANGNVHVTCQRANFVESIFLGGQLQNVTVPAVTTASGTSENGVLAVSYTRYMNASIDPYLGFVPPLGLKYYTYNGTLTTPPCTTGVQWILHAVPVLIYNTTVALWKNISGAYIDNGLTTGAINHTQNARPTQPMDGRTLYIGGKTGYTVLSDAALAGTNVLKIVDHAGFAVGDTIIIEAGTSRQEGNVVSAIGSLVLATPLHYSHPAGASVYSQTTTSPAVTVTPAAGAVTTTPVATVTPIAPLRRYTEGKDASKHQDKTGFASNAVYLGVGGLIGVSVVMIVQGARSKMRSAVPARNMEASNSDCDEGEARLLSSLE